MLMQGGPFIIIASCIDYVNPLLMLFGFNLIFVFSDQNILMYLWCRYWLKSFFGGSLDSFSKTHNPNNIGKLSLPRQ